MISAKTLGPYKEELTTVSRLVSKQPQSRAWYCYGKMLLDIFWRFHNPVHSPYYRSSQFSSPMNGNTRSGGMPPCFIFFNPHSFHVIKTWTLDHPGNKISMLWHQHSNYTHNYIYNRYTRMDALTWRWMNTLLQKSIPTLPMWTPQILERSFTGRQTIRFLSRKLQLWCFPHFLNLLMLLLPPCSLPPGSMLVTLMATVIRLGLNLVNAFWNPLQLTASKIDGILSCAIYIYIYIEAMREFNVF